MEPRNISMLDFVKMMMRRLESDELMEVRGLLEELQYAQKARARFAKRKSVLDILKEAREKEGDRTTKMLYTRMIKAIEQINPEITTGEFSKISKDEMLKWNNVGQRSIAVAVSCINKPGN